MVLGILEKEVEWLQGERRQLEAHLTRTEVWGENLGKWRAVVQSADVLDEKEQAQFVIVVDMIEDNNTEIEEEISSGWVVSRTLSQFYDLHRKLRPLSADIRNLELPSQSFKFLFGKSDRNSLEKAKHLIQKYLEVSRDYLISSNIYLIILIVVYFRRREIKSKRSNLFVLKSEFGPFETDVSIAKEIKVFLIDVI